MEEEEKESKTKLLTDQTEYLEVGIQIGTRIKTPGMSRFIYKRREDGLYILELAEIDRRIRAAARMLAAVSYTHLTLPTNREV